MKNSRRRKEGRQRLFKIEQKKGAREKSRAFKVYYKKGVNFLLSILPDYCCTVVTVELKGSYECETGTFSFKVSM
jgi:hypothetical protein